MGTWELGPFDNDAAADWASDLEHTPPGDRASFLRRTLQSAAEDPHEAVAAAAVVAAQLLDGPAISSVYSPASVSADSIKIDEDLRLLALHALTEVSAPESYWLATWEEVGQVDQALAALEPLRTALSYPHQHQPRVVSRTWRRWRRS